MAVVINEQQMVENNTFLYEDRIKSPTSRFLDTTPTFVTYYHINIDESLKTITYIELLYFNIRLV